VCSERVNAERQAELEAGLSRWIEDGNSVLFGTFTIRHHAGQSLAQLWDAIAPAWNRTTSGAGVAWNGGRRELGDKARFGIAGYARVVEVKHSWTNGWHPHIHSLLFIKGQIAESDIEELQSRMFGRWSKALGKVGYSTLEFDRDGKAIGADIRRVRNADYMADYFQKNGYQPAGTSATAAAYEVTGSHSKTAGKGGRTPFEVLAGLVLGASEVHDGGMIIDTVTGEITAGQGTLQSRGRDLGLWHEWEATSRGRRQLTWSRGMRDLLGLDVELTDEEIAENDALEGEVMSLIG
jgi:hypothetical protein